MFFPSTPKPRDRYEIAQALFEAAHKASGLRMYDEADRLFALAAKAQYQLRLTRLANR